MNLSCPMCQSELKEIPGHQVDATEGVTLRCINERCSAQAVEAWGKNIKDAMEVIHHKFSKKKG